MGNPQGVDFALPFSVICFLVTFLAAAPYVHEMSHAIALSYSGCPYFLPDFRFSLLNGLEGSIKILCKMPVENYPLVLVAGALSTFIVGNLLFLAVFAMFLKRNYVHLSTLMISFGFIISSLMYFFEKGEFDLFLLVKGFGIDEALLPAIGTPLVLVYLYIVYRFMDLYMEREVEEEKQLK